MLRFYVYPAYKVRLNSMTGKFKAKCIGFETYLAVYLKLFHARHGYGRSLGGRFWIFTDVRLRAKMLWAMEEGHLGLDMCQLISRQWPCSGTREPYYRTCSVP